MPPGVNAYAFEAEGSSFVIAYSVSGEARYQPPFQPKALEDVEGQPLENTGDEIPLTGSPVYLLG